MLPSVSANGHTGTTTNGHGQGKGGHVARPPPPRPPMNGNGNSNGHASTSPAPPPSSTASSSNAAAIAAAKKAGRLPKLSQRPLPPVMHHDTTVNGEGHVRVTLVQRQIPRKPSPHTALRPLGQPKDASPDPYASYINEQSLRRAAMGPPFGAPPSQPSSASPNGNGRPRKNGAANGSKSSKKGQSSNLGRSSPAGAPLSAKRRHVLAPGIPARIVAATAAAKKKAAAEAAASPLLASNQLANDNNNNNTGTESLSVTVNAPNLAPPLPLPIPSRQPSVSATTTASASPPSAVPVASSPSPVVVSPTPAAAVATPTPATQPPPSQASSSQQPPMGAATSGGSRWSAPAAVLFASGLPLAQPVLVHDSSQLHSPTTGSSGATPAPHLPSLPITLPAPSLTAQQQAIAEAILKGRLRTASMGSVSSADSHPASRSTSLAPHQTGEVNEAAELAAAQQAAITATTLAYVPSDVHPAVFIPLPL